MVNPEENGSSLLPSLVLTLSVVQHLQGLVMKDFGHPLNNQANSTTIITKVFWPKVGLESFLWAVTPIGTSGDVLTNSSETHTKS